MKKLLFVCIVLFAGGIAFTASAQMNIDLLSPNGNIKVSVAERQNLLCRVI
jgi:DUF4097 and DUF4098 domain-containing protein YvlB